MYVIILRNGYNVVSYMAGDAISSGLVDSSWGDRGLPGNDYVVNSIFVKHDDELVTDECSS